MRITQQMIRSEKMSGRRGFKTVTASLVALGMVSLSAFGGIAQASPTKTASTGGFYKGKTLTLLVPNAPGGDMDVSARLIAPYLRKALGASAVRILDAKGAGGVIGLNRLWSSPKDGFTIGYTSIPTVIMTSLLNGSSVKYDASKFIYIGRASTAPRVLVVSSKSGITSIAGLKAASKVTMSIQGFDDDFYTQAAIVGSLGIQTRFISGFDSLASETVSVSNGATTGLEASLAAESSVITAGLVKPILMLSDSPVKGFESVPTWISIVPESGKPLAEAFQSMILLGRSFFAPPGIPAVAVTALRAGVEAALKDTDLAHRLAKAQVPALYMAGADEDAAVSNILTKLQSTLAPLKDAKAQVEGK